MAVISRRLEGERKRIYTASYMLLLRGRYRGRAKVSVNEVGDTPDTVLQDVLRGVQDRAGDTEPAVEISPSVWFPPDDPTESEPIEAPSVDVDSPEGEHQL